MIHLPPATSSGRTGVFSWLRTTYERLTAVPPPWLSIVVGVVCIAVGLVLLFRPFLSLGVLIFVIVVALIITGVAELTGARRSVMRAVSFTVWIFAAGAVLLWPGLTIAVLTLLIAVTLAVSGLSRIIDAVRGTTPERFASFLLGLAAMTLAIVAISWPDATVFVIAAVFGVQLVLFGVEHLVRGGRKYEYKRVLSRWGALRHGVSAVVALTASAALLMASVTLSATPTPDDFYTAPPEMPETPGVLIRAELSDRQAVDGAQTWRMLYTTTDANDTVIVASGLIVTPQNAQHSPAIAWAHGTTGFARGCAPSLLDEPFVAGGMPALDETIGEGWSIVATDYPGLGTEGIQPYLLGDGEGRAVLDAVRAAQQLDALSLNGETVIWGHSQGGHASLWAGGLAPIYAPELDIVGVVAMAPASDLPVLLDDIKDTAMGSVFGSFALAAYAGTYSNVRVSDYVRPGALLMMSEMQSRCLTDPATLVSLVTALCADGPVWSQSPATKELGSRAEENVPRHPIEAPLLLAQGTADPLVSPRMQLGYVTERCAAGQVIDYRLYEGADHMGLVADSTLVSDIMLWSADRFAGVDPGSVCTTR